MHPSLLLPAGTWLGLLCTTACQLAAAFDTKARDTTCKHLQDNAGGQAGL